MVPCGTYIVVDDDTRKSLLQRVLIWAQLDREKIEYRQGYAISYVFIPAEVAAADHGDLVLRAGAEPVTLGVDVPVWIDPTIFDVDGINPNTGIEYDQVVSDFGPRGEPGSKSVKIGWTYSGNLEQRTEPTGWLLRYRQVPAEGTCPPEWRTLRLAGWQREAWLRGLLPETAYEVTLQGIAQPGSTPVFTEAITPITVTTAAAGDGDGDGDGDGGDQAPKVTAEADPADSSGRTVVLHIDNTGTGDGDGGSGDGGDGDGTGDGDSGGGDTAAALEAHIAQYHTTKTLTSGITAVDGWSVTTQQLTITPDALVAVVTIARSGPDVAMKPAPEAGNIVPDLLVANAEPAWRPAGPDPIIFIGATGFGHGSMRVTAQGEIYLLDWSNDNPLKTGQNVRFTYVIPGSGKSAS